MENKENIKADFNFKPEKDDSNLYVFMTVVHRDWKSPHALCLKIADLNKKYVSHQLAALAGCAVRTLSEDNIISE